MSDMMTFPDTWEEFEKSYGFTDNEEVYTNGARLIPSFRVKQWLDHLPSVQLELANNSPELDSENGELISRQAAIDEIDEWIKAFRENGHKESAADACLIQDGIIQLPSVQPEIIRCKDCKWWDKEDDMLLGYCLAIKHGFYSRNWDISIRRTYPEDFFCADAELRGEEDE